MTDLELYQTEWLEPLRAYYASAGAPLPSITVVAAQDVPQPYHRLLVHQEDMTTALERYHGGRIALRLLRAETENGILTRHVVLVLTSTGPHAAQASMGEGPGPAPPAAKPVEFGAIRIHLGRFGPQPLRMILEGRRPLGGILKESGLRYVSRPGAFIRVRSDAIVNSLMGLTGEHQLFGRYNILYDPTEQPLAEVIEILPPIGPFNPGKGQS